MPDNALLGFLGESPEEQRARFIAQDPEYMRELDAYEAQRKPVVPFSPSDVVNKLKWLSDLVTRSRSQPEYFKWGIDARPVSNPRPAQPYPDVGGVRGDASDVLNMIESMAG